jgi:carboxy-cis,cis-muconate cyclase
MLLLVSSIVCSLAPLVAADRHHLFASAYRSPHLFSLEYDTVTNSITQVANFTAHAGHPWLTFAFDRATLYGAERDGWSSYAVTSPKDLTFQSNLTLRGRCDGGNYRRGTTSVIAEQRAPYNIFGAGRSPCGNVIASKVDGSFDRIVQNISYQPSSRVHGMALDQENAYLYSADVSANGIWTHKVDPVMGTLTNPKFKTHSEANSRPRRLALHPQGRYLYVLLSKTNKLAVYEINMQASGPQLTNTGLTYNLVPPGT